MNSSLLIVIESDPRSSGRPAEAIRIAAGLGSWERVKVSVYLGAAAPLILSEGIDSLVDVEQLRQYLPILAGWQRPLYLEAGSPHLCELDEAATAFRPITISELAVLCLENRYLIRF